MIASCRRWNSLCYSPQGAKMVYMWSSKHTLSISSPIEGFSWIMLMHTNLELFRFTKYYQSANFLYKKMFSYHLNQRSSNRGIVMPQPESLCSFAFKGVGDPGRQQHNPQYQQGNNAILGSHCCLHPTPTYSSLKPTDLNGFQMNLTA